jgi:methyl-accepting chemotaxis protein
MEKPPEQGESLSISEQLPSFTPNESPKVESAPESRQGVFAFFEKASLKTQQLVTASTAGVVSSLVVVAVIQLSAKTVLQQGSTPLSQLTEMGFAALVTAAAVGVTTFALGQITINQINRAIDNLQAQFNAVARGDLGAQATVYSPNELGQLAMSFNQMTQAINSMLGEAQRKADEQEKAKEDLQHQLVQLLQNVEENFCSDLTVYTENTTSEEEENEQDTASPGTLLEFIDYLHNTSDFRKGLDPNLFLGNNRLEDIQRHKDEVEYREVWLKSLWEETQRELKFLALVIQSADKNKVEAINDG